KQGVGLEPPSLIPGLQYPEVPLREFAVDRLPHVGAEVDAHTLLLAYVGDGEAAHAEHPDWSEVEVLAPAVGQRLPETGLGAEAEGQSQAWVDLRVIQMQVQAPYLLGRVSQSYVVGAGLLRDLV